MADDDNHDVEMTGKKLKYPKHVFFILANEFCERFSYYGMRAILIIYLTNVLKFNDDDATVIYHAFTMLCYFTPLFGAMIADSFLGKFRTIFYLSIVYAAGNIVLSLSATPPLSIPQVPFSLIGLVLISIGTGGIKPCVSAFGGDQFIIPQQEQQLASFFSIFYFSINSGSLISTFLTPIFRKDIHCFEDDSCYPLAFGVPAALMITSLVVFVVGRPWYRIRKPTGNVVVAVLRTISHAFSMKRKSSEKREHWLDYAVGKYSKREVEDIKVLLRVLFLYLPLPFFWALFDQQGSRWTLQASRMDGELSSSFTLKPDQMQVVNPLLVLAFIPIFDKGIYPALAKCNIIKKPLQRLTMGGIFAGIAFVISGIVELELQKTYPVEIAGGESHLHFLNMANQSIKGMLTPHDDVKFELDHKGSYVHGIIEATNYTLTLEGQEKSFKFVEQFVAPNEAATSIMIVEDGDDLKIIYPKRETTNKTDEDYSESEYDTIDKSDEGDPFLRFIVTGLWKDPVVVTWENESNGTEYDVVNRNKKLRILLKEAKKGKDKDDVEYTFSPNSTYYADWESTPTQEVPLHDYIIYIVEDIDGQDSIYSEIPGKLELKLGGSYVVGLVLNKTVDGKFEGTYTVGTVIEPNSLHMLWLLPQYIVMTMGEIMFSITIMDFSYQEAPKTMKSVMQSAWLMTVAFGNLIVVIIAEAHFFKEQWKEFFLFAGLMFLDMIVFSYMAYIYVPANRGAQNDVPDGDMGSDKDKKHAEGGLENPTFVDGEKHDHDEKHD